MAKELLSIVEVVANEKDVDRAIIFEALEAALAAATKKRHGDEEIEVRVNIDQRTGDYRTLRIWHIVDDDAILENPHAQIRETVARAEFPDADLHVGGTHEIPLANEPFGRISAQMAKQIIFQKLREAEREKVYRQFIDKEGELVHGIVRRHERGNAIVDVGGVEGTILRSEMIPREPLRAGDRVLGYLKSVNSDMRSPQLQISRVAVKFLILLFEKEVPEIQMGTIEIMGAARDPGMRAKIAVRTLDPRIDPVGACVGIRGSRVQGVMNELAGERIDIVLWDEEPQVYVQKAMAPASISDTLIDEKSKIIAIAVPEEKLPQAVGRGGQNVRLASELTGWTIDVLSETQFAARVEEMQDAQEAALCATLGVDREIAVQLLSAGYDSAEAVAYGDRDALAAIAGFDAQTIDVILERATDYLLTQAFVAESDPKTQMQTPIDAMEEIDDALVEKLLAQDIHTRENLAELDLDELMAITGMDQETASALILKAREPWFRQVREREAP